MPIGTLVAANWGQNGYDDNPYHHTLWVTAFYPDGSADLQSAIPIKGDRDHYFITPSQHYTAEQLQSYYRVLSKMQYDPIASQGYLREPDINGLRVYRAQPVPGFDDLHPGQGPEDVSIGGYTTYSAGNDPFAFDSMPSTYIGDRAGGGGASWGRSAGFLTR